MDHRDWGRIQEIYDSALPLPPAERGAFVAKECHNDPALTNEVNKLLHAHDSSGDFLESSLFEMGLEVISKADDDLVGTIVNDRYRVEQVLAEGGMGKLYLAADSNLHDQPVALKVLSQTLLPDAAAENRFRQEVQALTLVKHPNVVRVLDAGRLSNGKPYVVMEYIDGVTLRSFIPSRGMDLKYAESLLKEIGAALGYIHNQGIVHCDLKPENIMIQVLEDGTEVVKILDFGIAKVDSVLTGILDHVRIGTEAYMSPEQKHGDQITAASDIYAMAVIAYEMVNGKRPPDPASTPLRRGRLLRKAHKLILRGLSLEPADRPQSAKQFGEDLKKALVPSIPIAIIATAVAILSLLSFGLYKYGNQPIVPLPASKGFDYWLIVQPMHDGREYGNSYKSNGDDDTFESGDRFQLNVRSLESGYLHIFNEMPPGTGNVSFRMVYPNKTTNNGSASIGGNQTFQSDWIAFGGPPGAENFWIIWSASPISELESAKNEALVHPQAGLSEPNLAKVKEFLNTTNAKVDARVTNYKTRNEATVRARNDLVLTLVQFKHR